MKSAWDRVSGWTYSLEGRRWQLWALAAVVVATLLTVLPSPWSWAITLPIAAFGVLLFDAQARRDWDEVRQRTVSRN